MLHIITNVDVGLQQFEILGDHTLRLPLTSHFQVLNSTANDGIYEVSGVIFNSTHTVITTIEVIPDPTIDGDVRDGSYELDFTDGLKTPLSLAPFTIDTSTSLNLPARERANYGEHINENFLHILETFSNSSAPINPIEGHLWYDTNSPASVKVFNGATWDKVSVEMRIENGTTSVAIPTLDQDIIFTTAGVDRGRIDNTGGVIFGGSNATTADFTLYGGASPSSMRMANGASGLTASSGIFFELQNDGTALIYNYEAQPLLLGSNGGNLALTITPTNITAIGEVISTTGYGDEFGIGGNAISDDLEIFSDAPAGRNVVTLWNRNLSTRMDLNAKVIDAPTINSTTVGATTGNITTVNSTTVGATTGNITTVNSTTTNATTVDATNVEVDDLRVQPAGMLQLLSTTSDNMYIKNVEISPNVSSLRISLGDNPGSTSDKLEIGADSVGFDSKLIIDAVGNLIADGIITAPTVSAVNLSASNQTATPILKLSTSGAVGAPSIQLNDTNTGFYGDGTVAIRTTINGTSPLGILDNGLSMSIDGSQGVPSIRLNDADTGFFKQAPNVIGMSAGGALITLVHTGGFAINIDGSAAAPSLRWNTDALSDTGFYHPGDGRIGIGCNAAPMGEWSGNGIGFGALTVLDSGIVGANNAVGGAGGWFFSTHATFTGTAMLVSTVRAASTAFDLITAAADGTNKFRVDGAGTAYATSHTTGGADFAEAFEWQDGNTSNEDRIGKSIIIDNGKIRFWQSGDADPDGIITTEGLATAIGNAAPFEWQGKYTTDDFGRTQTETADWWTWPKAISPTIDELEDPGYFFDEVPSGVVVPVDKTIISLTRSIKNPAFDPDLVYIPRLERKEWDAVALHGIVKLHATETKAAHWKKLRDVSASVEEYYIFPK